MQFSNAFDVPAPLDQVWAFFLDTDRVAPCVPGAQITEAIDDRHFKGLVKVRLGAAQLQFRGEVALDPDPAINQIVLQGKGSDVRGSGNASGTFTVQLSEAAAGTHVDVQTDLDVSGKIVQFGRGIIPDVAGRLTRQFAQNVATALGSQAPDSPESAPPEASLPPAEATPGAEAPPAGSAGTAADSSPGSASAEQSAEMTRHALIEGELSLRDLVSEVLRVRLARWLRAAADRVEPS